MTNKSEMFHAAHAAAKAAMAEQWNLKHPSAHKSYKALFALCLRGVFILERPVVVREKVQFMWLRGM